MRRGYVPDRGDVIWLDFVPQAGHEQKGRQPAVVLSPASYNKIGLAVCCPVTSQAKGYPFEVELPQDLSVQGVVLSDHVKSADWRERHAELIGKAPADLLQQVRAKLKPLLGA